MMWLLLRTGYIPKYFHFMTGYNIIWWKKEEKDLFFNLMLKLPMYPQVTQQRLN
jgi:hypothetical protein